MRLRWPALRNVVYGSLSIGFLAAMGRFTVRYLEETTDVIEMPLADSIDGVLAVVVFFTFVTFFVSAFALTAGQWEE